MGAYFEARKNNRYKLVVTIGHDEDGKPVVFRDTITAKNEKEAYKLLYEFEKECVGMIKGSKNIKLSEFAKLFFEFCDQRVVDEKMSPKTVSDYKKNYYKRTNIALGFMKLQDINPVNIMKFYKALSKEKKPRTAKLCHQVLSAMLTKAVYWQYIRENPCKRVEPPEYKEPVKDLPEIGLLKKVLEKLESEKLKYQIFVHLVLSIGMRPGEALGVEYHDIDNKTKTIFINRESQYVDKEIIETNPKTQKSKAEVDAPEYLLKMIRRHKREQIVKQLKLGDKWVKTDRLFTTEQGGIMHPQTYKNWWSKFLEKNEFEHFRTMDLRHAYSSLLLAGGMNYKEVANKMRHSTPAMVIKRYGYDIKDRNKESVNIIEKALK